MKGRFWGILAFGVSAHTAPLSVEHWTGGLRASIWDDEYDRGLGATGGAEAVFPWGTGAARLGYSFFHSRYGFVEDVHEIEAVAGPKWEFHFPGEQFLFPRLGVNAGFSFNRSKSLHFILGADAEGLIPIGKRWSLFGSFQPGYSLGAYSQMFWRVSLGARFHAQP